MVAEEDQPARLWNSILETLMTFPQIVLGGSLHSCSRATVHMFVLFTRLAQQLGESQATSKLNAWLERRIFRSRSLNQSIYFAPCVTSCSSG
jgi:hypothetical protein